uniref:cellulase n=1 Tax=Cryptococcus sp. S-2 TaxID=87049 RepID=A4UU22_9TREE|nr:carboxymethylcellulase [Cryptococcus sp. S-2]
MKTATLLASLSVLAGALAAPLAGESALHRRTLPRLGGVNLAGCDFGIDIYGNSGTPACPGTEQVGHFIADGANLFRLPAGWQYLVGNNQASTSLAPDFFAQYDALVQAVISKGAYAIIDVHNYARWNGAIIGQGGPSNQDFANLWTLLATKYKNDPNVIFGLMNEPHDLDVPTWAGSVQAAVNAIRAAGATSQYILVPGTGFTNANAWFEGQDNALLGVTDPVGGTDKLLLDVHRYNDVDFSGTHAECTTNSLDVLSSLDSWLQGNGRKAIVSETGGGHTTSCETDLGEFLHGIKEDYPSVLGFAVWAAGSFDPSYVLSITPTNGVDNQLFDIAVKPNLP